MNDNLQTLVSAWQLFLTTQQHWQDLVRDCLPRMTNNGLVYELPNVLNRDNEGFALVDMRHLAISEPHYHPDNDIEVYFVLQGKALVIVGGTERMVQVGDVVVIPPYNAHYTLPQEEFVIAVVNTPPYTPENYILLTHAQYEVGFDEEQFKKHVTQAQQEMVVGISVESSSIQEIISH